MTIMNDTQLYSAIFKYHFDTLYNYGMKITNDSELVKDCIQELFFRIWKNDIDLAKVNFLKSYLLIGLRRQILNMLELKFYHVDNIKLEDHFLIEFSAEDYFIQQQFEEDQRKNIIRSAKQTFEKTKRSDLPTLF